MRSNLYPEDLEFFQEAKDAFEKNPFYETYTNREETLIALRYGMDRDCIKIYRLDEGLVFLHNVMNKCPLDLKKKGDK